MPRLDVYLYREGYARSRSLAGRLVRGGFVLVNGKKAEKCGLEIGEGDEVSLCESPELRYVSRGGLKLEAALCEFGVSPEGKHCADIGASTGGFTDCLLQHGAEKVWAVDSGTDQLFPSLRENERVISMESCNARFLDESKIAPVALVVMDVSFISQSLLYPAVAKILLPEGDFISLIKPQFEVGRDKIGSGGIVRDEKSRLQVIEHLRELGKKHGLVMQGCIPSPITGGDGNVEYLAHWKKGK